MNQKKEGESRWKVDLQRHLKTYLAFLDFQQQMRRQQMICYTQHRTCKTKTYLLSILRCQRLVTCASKVLNNILTVCVLRVLLIKYFSCRLKASAMTFSGSSLLMFANKSPLNTMFQSFYRNGCPEYLLWILICYLPISHSPTSFGCFLFSMICVVVNLQDDFAKIVLTSQQHQEQESDPRWTKVIFTLGPIPCPCLSLQAVA